MKTNLRKDTTRVKTPLSVFLTLIVTALVVELHLTLYAAPAPVSLWLKGSWPPHPTGPAVDIALQGQYAYVTAERGGLIILDVSAQTRSSLSQDDWQDFGAPTSENRVILQPDKASGFVRVLSLGRP